MSSASTPTAAGCSLGWCTDASNRMARERHAFVDTPLSPQMLHTELHGVNEGYRVWKEPWPKNQQPVQTFEAPVPIESHIQNFLDCVKSRKEPNAPVEVGASAVSAPHLANVAFHHDRRMYLSADAAKATERPEG